MDAKTLMADLRNPGVPALAPEDKPSLDDALIPREITLNVSYVQRGKTLKASVTSTVPDGEAKRRIDRAMALQANGVEWESFPITSRGRMRALSIVANQISGMPEWMELAIAEDDGLLMSLHEEAESHTLRYFLGDEEEGDGEKAEPRVGIAVVDWRSDG